MPQLEIKPSRVFYDCRDCPFFFRWHAGMYRRLLLKWTFSDTAEKSVHSIRRGFGFLYGFFLKGNVRLILPVTFSMAILHCLHTQEIRVSLSVPLPYSYTVGKAKPITPGYWEKTHAMSYDRKTVLHFFCESKCADQEDNAVKFYCDKYADAKLDFRGLDYIDWNNAGVCFFLQGNYNNAYNALMQSSVLSEDTRVLHNLRVCAHVINESIAVVKD